MMEGSRPSSLYDIVHKKRIIFYLYLLPMILLVVIFGIWPIAESIRISFTDSYTALSDAPKFVGLKNYITIFKDSYFISSILITLKFTVISVPMNIFLAFLFAMMLTSDSLSKGRTFYKLAVFIPIITSDLVVSIVWRWMYNKEFGAVNAILDLFGAPSFAGLSSPKTVLMALMIVALWKNVGMYTVIFMTNIQLIDRTLYEAASIDGANYLKRIGHVTIPELRPAILLNSVYAIIQYLKVFTLARIMTNGGPNYSSNFVAYYAYDKFGASQFGEATAMGTILFIIIIVMFVFTYWLNRRGT